MIHKFLRADTEQVLQHISAWREDEILVQMIHKYLRADTEQVLQHVSAAREDKILVKMIHKFLRCLYSGETYPHLQHGSDPPQDYMYMQPAKRHTLVSIPMSYDIRGY